MSNFDVPALEYPGSDSLLINPTSPPGSKPLQCPDPIIKADRLCYLIWDVVDFDAQEEFLKDFGMLSAFRDEDRLFMRAYGDSPYVYYGRKAKQHRFVGMGFAVNSRADLETLSHKTGHVIEPIDRPGDGEMVCLKGPLGLLIEVTFGIKGPGPRASREALLPVNTPDRKTRINRPQRPELAPAPVMAMGHCVTGVNRIEDAANWFMRHLGLIPSDVLCLEDGSPMLAFMRLDRGDKPADHHTVVVVKGAGEGYLHSAYEVLDIDALAQGQQFLKMKKRHHVWGLGRHILGSQIFDYWKDPNGFEFEHYADGDVFTSDHPTGYHLMDPGNIYAWGQDMPKAMLKPDFAAIKGVLRGLLKGDISFSWLKMAKKTMARPPRPWL